MASYRVRRGPARTLVAVCIAVSIAFVLVPGATKVDAQSIEEVREEVERLHHEAVVVTEEYNVAAEQLKAAEKELDKVRERVEMQQEELNRLQRELGVYVAMAYQSAGIDETVRLLSTDDLERFLEQAAMLDQLAAHNADALRRVQLARQQLEATKLEAAQKLEEIEQAHAALKEKKEEIERKQRAATALLNRLTAEQRAALNEPSEDLPDDVPVSGRAAAAVEYAKAQLGDPYVWGGAGPDSWDCSGLTMMAWRQAGVSLPHSSAMQYNYGTRVSKSELQPGDLVFFYSPISHVGIYIGGGKMIHAPRPGDVVKVSSISLMPYVGATRPG